MSKKPIKNLAFGLSSIAYGLNEVAQHVYTAGQHAIYNFPGGTQVRNHLSSFAGALAISFLIENRFPKKHLRSEFTTAATGTLLTMYELISMPLQKGKFDWYDMAMYGMALGIFYKISKREPEVLSDNKAAPPKPSP